jgi:hypothetical protein
MRLTLAALLALVLATPVSGQIGALIVTAGMPDSSAWGKSTRLPELKTCGELASRVGLWKSAGPVAFTIDSTGRVDTVSVMVVNSGPASEEGLESYARRLVMECAWKPAQVDGRKSSVIVRLKISPEAGRALFSGGPMLPPPTEAGLYLQTSPRLEEHPRERECEIHGRTGRVDLSLIVGTDGMVEVGSVSIIETNSQGTANAYLKTMPNCVFQPGRVGGVPVRTKISMTINLVPRYEVRTTPP